MNCFLKERRGEDSEFRLVDNLKACDMTLDSFGCSFHPGEPSAELLSHAEWMKSLWRALSVKCVSVLSCCGQKMDRSRVYPGHIPTQEQLERFRPQPSRQRTRRPSPRPTLPTTTIVFPSQVVPTTATRIGAQNGTR